MEDVELLKQLLNPFITERLGEAYRKDEEYQKRLKAEDLIYESLSGKLTDEQAEQLEEYFVAANATAARIEILTYIQGMKDLLALLKTLS